MMGGMTTGRAIVAPRRSQERTRVKICCIASVEEARLAVALGADAVGLVARMPSGPGPITDDLIADIARTVPPPMATFLLTCETDVEAIVDHAHRTRTNVLQLVDWVEPAHHRAIRAALPGVKLVQVLHVEDDRVLDQARRASGTVDALLLDSGRPAAATKELGGTGRLHDWALSREVVERFDIPVFLAGGLDAGNAAEAIARVRPFGLDVCSGVRTDDDLDPTKAAAFMAAARKTARPRPTR